jgi:hypothetical protein
MMVLVDTIPTKLVSVEVIQEFPNKKDREWIDLYLQWCNDVSLPLEALLERQVKLICREVRTQQLPMLTEKQVEGLSSST